MFSPKITFMTKEQIKSKYLSNSCTVLAFSTNPKTSEESAGRTNTTYWLRITFLDKGVKKYTRISVKSQIEER